MTCHELVEDTWAAILGDDALVGTVAFAGVENSATPFGRYAGDLQNDTSLSEPMPMATSTLPSLSAASGSVPTSTISSFKPSWSASAAATSTSMPTIFDEDEGKPANGGDPAFTPTRNVPLLPMVGDDTVALFSGGV